MQGKFITLEGIDGAGKSTQLAWIIELLQRAGLTTMVTREPGGTALGEQLRALLLDKSIATGFASFGVEPHVASPGGTSHT